MARNTGPRPSASRRHAAVLPAALGLLLLLAVPLQAGANPGQSVADAAEGLAKDGACVTKPQPRYPLETFSRYLTEPNAYYPTLLNRLLARTVCVDTCESLPDPDECYRTLDQCPTGQVGGEPACVQRPVLCDGDEVGLEPVCVAEPPLCDPGQVGTPPACVPPEWCPTGQVGVPPVCRPPPPLGCPEGRVGVPPACVVPPTPCPLFYVGVQPNCIPVPIIVPPICPLGTVGVPPYCESVPDPCMDSGGNPPDCWIGDCSPVDCAMRILFDDGGILDTGLPQPVPLGGSDGPTGPDVWCSGPEADWVDTYCEKSFDVHKIKAIGYFYNERTTGANHVGISHGYEGKWWYEDWRGGRVDKACTDSGGKRWVGSHLTGGLSADQYVGTYGVPDCRTSGPKGAWGGLAYFK